MRPCHGPIKGLTRVVGVDVAKTSVVLFDSVTRRTWSVANAPEALRQALEPFAEYDLMVCEVTGGYERSLLSAALTLGLTAHRADPFRVKRYIASLGGAAKTDRIDAAWLARYGQERGADLVPWRPRDIDRDALASLLRHRGHLVAARVEAKNRRGAPTNEILQGFLDEQIAFLTQQVRRVEQAIATRLAKAPELAKGETALRAVSGFGPIVATSLLAFMPELGLLNRRQVASLSGTAPHPRDSGQFSGRRCTTKGRAELKPVLFMAALAAIRTNPILKAFAERLKAQGKPMRLILTAVARKLIVLANTIMREQLQLT